MSNWVLFGLAWAGASVLTLLVLKLIQFVFNLEEVEREE